VPTQDPNTAIENSDHRLAATVRFGVRTAILAGLILTPTAAIVTNAATSALQPSMFAGPHTTCCPPAQ
jgi:hypothetical protein